MAFPYYPAYQSQMYPNQYNTQQHGGLIWVQGIEAAKSYPVSAGQSILLMDSESNIFDYTERTANNVHKTAQETHTEPSIDLSAYVTRDELESRIKEIMAAKRNNDIPQRNDRKDGQNNGK